MAGGEEAVTIAEKIAVWASDLTVSDIPETVKHKAASAIVDVVGLAVAARNTEYVKAVKKAFPEAGQCTAFGHPENMSAAGAACLNGTAAHGEDFDDTYEGTPVHIGAVAVPAALAVCQDNELTGADLLKCIAVTGEIACRMAIVQPTAQHSAGFHPTSVIGTVAAAAGTAVALGLDTIGITNALGTAGSMASGIIEYLAEGSWTKRLHPGWAAQSAIRASYASRAGFFGPRTIFEGTHGFYKAFGVDSIQPQFEELTRDLGKAWHFENLAFKPYACGTMCQPFIDVAISLAKQGVIPSEIVRIDCKVGEATVHRPWEPREEKIKPSTPYSAKFSVPYSIAVGFLDRAAGLSQFTEHRIFDPTLLDLAAKVYYTIDPENEYPRNYSGHLRVITTNGEVHEAIQPHLRGGRHEPLTDEEISAKFTANMAFGDSSACEIESICRTLFEQSDMIDVRAFSEI